MRIKKNDQVIVVAGKDKGKTGKVMKILTSNQRVIIEKINMVKKAQRRTQQDQPGGFIEIESSVHLSNVMLIDRKTKKPTRVGYQLDKKGNKTRISKKSKEAI